MLKGIYNTLRPLADGRARLADADYIRDSLLHPQRNILEAYADADIGMPSYQGILTPSGIDFPHRSHPIGRFGMKRRRRDTRHLASFR